MNYFTEWNAISERINGVRRAVEFFTTNQRSRMFKKEEVSAVPMTYEHLGRMCYRTAYEIFGFSVRYEGVLSPLAVDAMNDFRRTWPEIDGKVWDRSRVFAAVTHLLAIQSEFTFFTSDTDQLIRSQTERAFLHLQRLLVADQLFARRWRSAFNGGELQCEKLGAAHLLWHGIWAFKTSAEGGRTDIAFNEPLDKFERRAADGLILTEWKKSSVENASEMFEVALRQSRRYASDTLAGVELSDVRYLVVVTPKEVPFSKIPDDFVKSDVLYRHINIAITRKTPSEDARSNQ